VRLIIAICAIGLVTGCGGHRSYSGSGGYYGGGGGGDPTAALIFLQQQQQMQQMQMHQQSDNYRTFQEGLSAAGRTGRSGSNVWLYGF